MQGIKLLKKASDIVAFTLLSEMPNDFPVCSLGQTHSSNVVRTDKPGVVENTDGIVTDTKGLWCLVKTSDCLPILLFDPKTKSIGICHAGWRGILGGIVGGLVGKMILEFKTDPTDLVVSIGPNICGNCFEVRSDVFLPFLEKYKEADAVNDFTDGKKLIDLEKICIFELTKAGIKGENIESLGMCTYEDPTIPSFRRDKVIRSFYTAIMLK